MTYQYPPGQPIQPLNYQSPNPAGYSDYAGFWLRLVAYIIDSLILAIPGCIMGLAVGLAFGAASAGSGSARHEAEPLANCFAQVLSILMSWLYFAFFESSTLQATPGKLALGLRVTDLQGAPISFGRATGRFFGKIISGLICAIGYIMAGFTERKQALHDQMASTLVVRK